VTLRGRDETWSALAFAAALLHVLNHAVFKAALFLGAGAFSRAVGSLELDRLGGLARRMPVTALAFGTAAMAIAGLPPLNGFASEWLAMQSLIRLPVSADDGTALAGAVGLAALAAMAALAVLCFVKVIGLVLLGEPRRPECEDAEEAPKAIRVSMLWLAGLCVVLGPLAAVLVPILAELSPVGGEFGTSISIEAAGTGTFPGLGILIALVAVVAGLMWLRGARRAAPAPTWICGQPPARELAWTSAGFTKTLRLALSHVLRPEREVVVRAEGGVNQQLVYRAEVPHLFDTRMYRPVATWSLRVAARVRRLQSGNLRSYIVYLFGLVLVLLAFARTGWIS
jgi:hydrogenase-4 component B